MRRALAPTLFCLLVATAGLSVACNGDSDPLSEVAPLLVTDADRLIFDNTYVGRTSTRTLTLRNAGTGPAEVSFALEPSSFSFVDSGDFRLEAGDVAQREIRFTPLQSGTNLVTVKIGGSAVDALPLEVSLDGRGLAVPDCDDENECTDNQFDFDTETCTSSFHDRSCDTLNPCTENGRCSSGQCLGTFRLCPSTSPCRMGTCDAQLGCVEIDVPGQCDDADPCTDDVCSDVGCTHATVADGTLCGAGQQCASVPVCQAGTCVSIPILDGAPCDDGNLCTADACLGGACVGAYVTGTPEIVTQYISPGGGGAHFAETTGGRLLVFDPARDGTAAPRRGWMSVVEQTDGAYQVVNQTALEFQATSILASPDSSTVVLHRNAGGSLLTRVFNIDTDGVLTAVGDIPNEREPVLFGTTLYFCNNVAGEPPIHIFDHQGDMLIDAGTAFDASLNCRDLAVDHSTETLMMLSSDAVQLHFMSLADPVSPIEVSTIGVSGLSGLNVRLAAGSGIVLVHDQTSPLQRFETATGMAGPAVMPPDEYDIVRGVHVEKDHIYAVLGASNLNSGLADKLFVKDLSAATIWSERLEVTGYTSSFAVGGPTIVGTLFAFQADPDKSSFFADSSLGPFGPLPALDLGGVRGGALRRRGDGTYLLTGADTFSIVDLTDDDTFAITKLPPHSLLTSGAVIDVQVPFTTRHAAPALASARPTLIFPSGGHAIEVLTLAGSDIVSEHGVELPPPLSFGDAPLAQPHGAQTNDFLAVVNATFEADSRMTLSLFALDDAPDQNDTAWPIYNEIALDPFVSAPIITASLVVSAHDTSVIVGTSTSLFLIDIADPDAPIVHPYAEGENPNGPPVRLLGTDGERVVAVTPGFVSLWEQNADGELIQTITSSSIALASLDLFPYVIFSFEGDIVVLGTTASLVYVQLSDPPQIIAEVPIGETPIGASTVGDRLLLTTDHGVTLVHPPCPAPMP